VKKKISIIKAILICLLLMASSLAVDMSAFSKSAAAAGTPDSCTPPSTTYGTDTMSVYVPATATYTIWTRLQAPSSSANSILLNIDNTNCYNVGGDSSIPTNNTWDWVDDYGGSTANLVNVSLSSGTHTFTLTGTESGVSIDRIIAVPTSSGNVSCTPSNTQDDTAGTNCAPLANTATAPPTVSVTAPSNSATVSGTTAVSATATDSVGIASVQFEVDGSALGSPVLVPSSGNTYSTSWNTSAVGNGSHTISAIATDTSGYTTTTGSTSVTVNNSTGGGGTTPPNAPTSVHVTTNAGTSVALSWTASTDTGGTVAGYHIYLNGSATAVASVTGTTYTATALTPGTAYSYSVAAYNSASTPNVSSKSAAASGRTCIAGDITCDDTVGLSDLTIMGQHWNTTSGATWAQGDLNGDGKINLTDLTILGQNWGK
jgi:hypothetical protein